MEASICRICLATSVEIFPLGDVEIKNFIESIFKNNGFDKDLDINHYACCTCQSHLRDSYNFVQRALKAQKELYTKNIWNMNNMLCSSLDLKNNIKVEALKINVKYENEDESHTDNVAQRDLSESDHIKIEIDGNKIKVDDHSNKYILQHTVIKEDLDSYNDPLSDNFSMDDINETTKNSCKIMTRSKKDGKNNKITASKVKKEKNNKNVQRKKKRQNKQTTSKEEDDDIKNLSSSNKPSKSSKNKAEKAPRSRKKPESEKRKRGRKKKILSEEELEHAQRTYPRKCDHCHYEVQKIRDHFRHYLYCHPDLEYPYHKLQAYVCQYCGKRKSTAFHHRMHELTHGEKTYECPICPKKFHNKIQLYRHKSRHGGSKFFCHFCGKGFIQRIDIVRHIRTHSGEKPFKCHICGAGFAHRGNMTLHLRSAHQQDFDEQKTQKAKRTNKSKTYSYVRTKEEMVEEMRMNEFEQDTHSIIANMLMG